MSKYLLEVGCEELPYKFIPSAIQQLKTSFENFLNSNKVEFEKVDVYATPRRLAVIISGLEKESKDEIKVVKGPVKRVAYDEAGNLTKAGEGFCKKNGIAPEDLPHLFERFYRGKGNDSQSIGIGLSLSQKIIVGQNGTIDVKNREKGGAVFRIRFYKTIV